MIHHVYCIHNYVNVYVYYYFQLSDDVVDVELVIHDDDDDDYDAVVVEVVDVLENLAHMNDDKTFKQKTFLNYYYFYLEI